MSDETKFYHGRPCTMGHTIKYVANRRCVECQRLRKAAYLENNREDWNAARREYYANNREKSYLSCQAYRAAHPGKVAAWCNRRRAAKLKATPRWLTFWQHAEITYFYEKARTLLVKTGVLYHVDHIVPLVSKNVCGLHVPWNLQLLEDTDNWRKGNRRA